MYRAAGFSLIEMLITVLVIVLLTSLVSLGVGRGGQDLKRLEQAEHLVSLMAYVQTEAELSGADHGLYLERQIVSGGDRYVGHWLRQYDQGWAEPRLASSRVLGFFFENEGLSSSALGSALCSRISSPAYPGG